VTAGHAPYLAPLALSATLAVGLARSRYAHPTAPERAMIGMLDELGQREGADYDRAYRGAPGVYADFAWPEQQLAIKGHGSAHDAAFFLARGWAEREARRAVVYADTGWSVRVVTARHLAEERAQTVAGTGGGHAARPGPAGVRCLPQEAPMANAQEATVQLIDEDAWERAEVAPIGAPRRIAGGPYDGGWVISADNGRVHLYFAMPAAATPLLRDRLPAAQLSAWH
jgi:hypothetical protein